MVSHDNLQCGKVYNCQARCKKDLLKAAVVISKRNGFKKTTVNLLSIYQGHFWHNDIFMGHPVTIYHYSDTSLVKVAEHKWFVLGIQEVNLVLYFKKFFALNSHNSMCLLTISIPNQKKTAENFETHYDIMA